MNKSAKEMYEALGFFERDKELFIEYIKIYDKNDNFAVVQFIHEDRIVNMCIKEDYENIMKAINQQCKELGWLDD